MLSVLIPVYNYDITELVNVLNKQLLETNIPFEIICIDDGSNSKVNKQNEKINTLQNALFIADKENLGLSCNRNNLAKLAKHEYFLFIDADSKIIYDNYIQNYIEVLQKKPDVVYGGRVHPENVEPKRKLRWKYGKYHEDSTALQRKTSKYISVLFNNTLISRKLFNKIYFNETIVTYGHEDTVFSHNLKLNKATVIHIDNSVLHANVDLNIDFFEKSHKSIKNLNYIYENEIVDSNFIKFLRIFAKLKKYRLNHFFSIVHKIFYPVFRLNLISKRPSLFIFNLFRISYFCNINLNK